MSEMEAFYSKNLGAIMGVSGAKKLEMDGYPSGIYYDWNEETGTTDMAAAIPFKNAGAGAGGNIKLIEVPAGKALLIDYYGGYYGLGQAHYAMDDYMKRNNLTQKAPVIEEYITDPGTEPDSSKWLTKIYYFF
jgi:effector-binding domain-containing protein